MFLFDVVKCLFWVCCCDVWVEILLFVKLVGIWNGICWCLVYVNYYGDWNGG